MKDSASALSFMDEIGYERRNPDKFLTSFSNERGPHEFYRNGGIFDREKYYKDKVYLKELGDEGIKIVSEKVNEELMNFFSYEIL